MTVRGTPGMKSTEFWLSLGTAGLAWVGFATSHATYAQAQTATVAALGAYALSRGVSKAGKK